MRDEFAGQHIHTVKRCEHNFVYYVCNAAFDYFRPLGSENLLLRGATLKNTEYIHGNKKITLHIYVSFMHIHINYICSRVKIYVLVCVFHCLHSV